MEKKSNSKSVTDEQKQLLIDFVQKHPKLCTKKFGPSFTKKNAQSLWLTITKMLNNLVGPKKTWIEWRKVIQVNILVFNSYHTNFYLNFCSPVFLVL